MYVRVGRERYGSALLLALQPAVQVQVNPVSQIRSRCASLASLGFLWPIYLPKKTGSRPVQPKLNLVILEWQNAICAWFLGTQAFAATNC
jgi:hypothetical protein